MTKSAPVVTLGAKLREMRKNSGKTQKQLAAKLGVCVRTLQDYEHDVSDIPTKKLLSAVIYCNCDIFQLMADFLPARLLCGTKAKNHNLSDTTERTIKK